MSGTGSIGPSLQKHFGFPLDEEDQVPPYLRTEQVTRGRGERIQLEVAVVAKQSFCVAFRPEKSRATKKTASRVPTASITTHPFMLAWVCE